MIWFEKGMINVVHVMLKYLYFFVVNAFFLSFVVMLVIL